MKSRQRILNYLKKVREAGSIEIARALNLDEPNVRHHLRVLLQEERVESKPKLTTGKKGRPEKSYSISQSALGDNFSVLADALLSDEISIKKLNQIAKRISGGEDTSKMPVPSRLLAMVEKMNRMHYQARWEAGSEGPRVFLERCPYAAIIDNHPELCRMDTLILEYLLNLNARQTGKIQKGQGVCMFLLENSYNQNL